MAGVYLLFGIVVERTCAPRGALAAFARLVCSPITRPVTRFLAPGASERRALAVSLAVVGGVWAALVAVDAVLR